MEYRQQGLQHRRDQRNSQNEDKMKSQDNSSVAIPETSVYDAYYQSVFLNNVFKVYGHVKKASHYVQM